jgi:hypothetical protein
LFVGNDICVDDMEDLSWEERIVVRRSIHVSSDIDE